MSIPGKLGDSLIQNAQIQEGSSNSAPSLQKRAGAAIQGLRSAIGSMGGKKVETTSSETNYTQLRENVDTIKKDFPQNQIGKLPGKITRASSGDTASVSGSESDDENKVPDYSQTTKGYKTLESTDLEKVSKEGHGKIKSAGMSGSHIAGTPGSHLSSLLDDNASSLDNDDSKHVSSLDEDQHSYLSADKEGVFPAPNYSRDIEDPRDIKAK